MDIEKNIANLLKKALERSGWFSKLTGSGEIKLQYPKDNSFGDLSSNIALAIAQKTARPALEIAGQILQQLRKELNGSKAGEAIEKIEVKGAGFINFFLSRACLYEVLWEISKKQHNFGRLKLGRGKKVHIEFVSANPTGPLNVAHGRQAAFGDTLANLLQFSGYKVFREYYLNDEGVQIDILGESVYAKYLELLGILGQFPAAGYQGKYIDNLAKALVARYGRKFTRTNSASEKQRAFICRLAMSQILKDIKADLKAFGVNYDSWFSQKKLTKTGKITKALGLLEKKGFIYKKDGACWLSTTRFGDDKDRVVIKSDLKFTYIAPDIAYHQTKFKRGFSKMFNIWGPDHHGYILRLKATVSALGYKADWVEVLIVQLVSLACADKIIPMSTRSGQYTTLHDIIQAVGKDAARFFFLMRKRDAHLHFDLELAKKQSLHNPVYYIQYAHARILNILNYAKSKKNFNILTKGSIKKQVNLLLLNKPEELKIIQTLKLFPSVVEACTLSLEPHRITSYLQGLVKEFHHYYERYRVVTEDLAVTQARLVLIDTVRIVLNNALCLLSISAPEKM